MHPEFIPFITNKLTDVSLQEIVNNQLKIPNTLHHKVEQVWTSLKNDQPALHPSPLYTVLTTDSEQQLIQVGTNITYKDVVGVRNTPDFKQYFKNDSDIPHVLSMIALVYTEDNILLLLERSSGDWPQSLELPGAFMRPAWGSDLYQQALNFLHKDLLVTKDDISTHKLYGALRYTDICEYMLITRFELKLSYQEVLRKNKKVTAIPVNYTVENHPDYFNLPLHTPSKTVLSMQNQF